MTVAIPAKTFQTSETSLAFGVWISVSLIALAIIVAIVGAPLALTQLAVKAAVVLASRGRQKVRHAHIHPYAGS